MNLLSDLKNRIGKNNLIAIIAIVLLVILGIALSKMGGISGEKNVLQKTNYSIPVVKNSKIPATSSATPYKQEVFTTMISAKGFSPPVLNVPLNGKVDFVNLAPSSVSIVFTEAPDTFNKNSSFDIATGQSFYFTASVSGKFTFVKKDDASQKGFMVVNSAL